MAINQIKPFATGVGANVATQEEYETAESTVGGFSSGVAPSNLVNKAIRQAAFVSSSIAQFTADKGGQDVLDDGDVEGIQAQFENALILHISSSSKWLSKGIGEYYIVRDDIEGVDIPPTNNTNFRYIKLTASDSYNTGCLTSETVTGAIPLTIATAVISLAGSPIIGKTINLLNTERRFIRAGSSGTDENDATQGHYHNATPDGRTLRPLNTNSGSSGSSVGSLDGSFTHSTTGVPVSDGTNGTPRTANETRVKNQGHTIYMRIK